VRAGCARFARRKCVLLFAQHAAQRLTSASPSSPRHATIWDLFFQPRAGRVYAARFDVR
jgi:hypothetical protein